MDTMQAFPAVILALALLALLGAVAAERHRRHRGRLRARTTRAWRGRCVLATKQNQFVEAERALGAATARIVGVHILPNIIAPLFILLAMDLPRAITLEAGLSFLGLGVQPPTPSWGVILADGFERVRDIAWPVHLRRARADDHDARLHAARRDAARRRRPAAGGAVARG